MESDQEDEQYETQLLLKSEHKNYYVTKRVVAANEGQTSSLDDEELTDGSSTRGRVKITATARKRTGSAAFGYLEEIDDTDSVGLRHGKKGGNRRAQASSRKRMNVPDSDDSDSSDFFVRQIQDAKEEGGRRIVEWSEEGIAAMLNMRFRLWEYFEHDDEIVLNRAWDKVAYMMNPPYNCNGEDCSLLFESIANDYLRKKRGEQYGLIPESSNWDYHAEFEKILKKSPRLAMYYAALEETLPKSEESETKEEVSSIHEDHQSDGCGLEGQTRAGREHSDEEYERILNPTTLFKEFAEHTSHYSKYYFYMMDYKKRQLQRRKELMSVFSDLMELKEQNMLLVSAFLKKLVARIRETKDLTRRDSLAAFAALFPCVMNGASEAVATMVQYFNISFKESEELENLTLILTAFSRLNSLVTDSPVAEDNFYASFLKFYSIDSAKMSKLMEWKNRSQLTTTNRSLADFSFKGMLNVCKTTVEKLIEVIGPRMPQKYGNRVLSVERQAIIGLWYMVHTETCEQMSIRFSVRLAAVTSIIHSFVTNVIDYGHFIKWPTTEEDVTKVVTDFEMMKKDAFPGVIGALGCKYLTFKCPVTPWAKYLMGSRPKDILYGLAVQGISDSHHVFTNLFVSWLELSDEPVLDEDHYEKPEGTQVKIQVIDVFTRSTTRCVLAKLPETGLDRLHVLADSTYPLLPTVMVPYGGELDEDSPEKLFNLYLQLTRSVVDAAFGKVMNRFKRLASMDHHLKVIQFIKAAFGIHNLCMRLGDDFEPKKIKLPEIRFEQEPTRGKELSLAHEKREQLCEGFQKRDIAYVYRKAEDLQDDVADAEIPKKE